MNGRVVKPAVDRRHRPLLEYIGSESRSTARAEDRQESEILAIVG
jgi:hypothetical protein